MKWTFTLFWSLTFTLFWSLALNIFYPLFSFLSVETSKKYWLIGHELYIIHFTHTSTNLAGIYLFKVNNENTRTMLTLNKVHNCSRVSIVTLNK